MARRSRDTAFREFFEAEVGRLQRFATFMCGDPDLALDLTQEALTRVYKRWAWVREAEAAVYARRTIVNLLRDRHRREQVRRERAHLEADGTYETSRAAHVDDWIVVCDALKSLSAIRRATIVLRFYEDMTEQEIADALDRPLGTVKSDLHRALRELRLTVPTDRFLEETT